MIVIHDVRAENHNLNVKRGGAIKCRGVIFDPDPTGKPQLLATLTEFKQIMAAVATRTASPELIKAVLESSLKKVAEAMLLSYITWSTGKYSR